MLELGINNWPSTGLRPEFLPQRRPGRGLRRRQLHCVDAQRTKGRREGGAAVGRLSGGILNSQVSQLWLYRSYVKLVVTGTMEF